MLLCSQAVHGSSARTRLSTHSVCSADIGPQRKDTLIMKINRLSEGSDKQKTYMELYWLQQCLQHMLQLRNPRETSQPCKSVLRRKKLQSFSRRIALRTFSSAGRRASRMPSSLFLWLIGSWRKQQREDRTDCIGPCGPNWMIWILLMM